MDPTRLMRSTVTITTKTGEGAKDEMGNPIETTTVAYRHRCWLWQVSRSEDTAGTDVQQETFQVGIDPKAAELVETVKTIDVDGIVYEFVGPPWAALHPRTGVVTHLEGTLRRTR